MTLTDLIRNNPTLTDEELAALPNVMDEPRLVPLADLNEILLASGAWAALQAISKSDNSQAAGLALTTLGLFQGKLNNFDARKPEYRSLLNNVLLLIGGYVSVESVAAIKELCGVGRANPTVEQLATARAGMTWQTQRDALIDGIAAKYNNAVTTVTALQPGDTLPTVGEALA